LNKKQA